MGRLFWKFFLFIWLGQLAGVLGTGALFWVERQQFAATHAEPHLPPDFAGHPRPGAGAPPPGPRPPRGGPLPVLPIVAGLLASLLCAAGLAWYFAKPIRQLRQGFDAAADGNLAVRVAPGMGGRRDELADLGKDFDRMTTMLQGLVQGQQRLLHDVSHEMRSPLARLQAAIGLARQQPGRIEDFLSRIEREGERIDRLIGELLTLSRLEAGVGGAAERVEMQELLAELVDDARFECGARGITIDVGGEARAEVVGIPSDLQRAIENVMRNAIQHSPAGGRIRIESSIEAGKAFHLSIADQGAGVAEAELKDIFDPFVRGRSEKTGSGHGLGLAIARRAILASGGEISARNTAAGGLVVEIKLPI